MEVLLPLSAEPLQNNNNPRIKEYASSVTEIRDKPFLVYTIHSLEKAITRSNSIYGCSGKYACIKSVSNNKAAGIDGIPAEFYKANPMQSPTLLPGKMKVFQVSGLTEFRNSKNG